MSFVQNWQANISPISWSPDKGDSVNELCISIKLRNGIVKSMPAINSEYHEVLGKGV